MRGQENKPITHEDIHARLASGQQRFAHVEDVLAKVEAALSQVIKGQDEFRATIKPISDDIAEIKSMVSVWKAAGVLGKAVKWLSGLAAGLVVIWVFAKAGAKALAGGL
jgi:hypothetical protein